jgi:hypothetical protein
VASISFHCYIDFPLPSRWSETKIGYTDRSSATGHPAKEDLFAGTPVRAAIPWRFAFAYGAGLLGAGLVFKGGDERVLDDAHVDVDGAHDGSDGFQLSSEPGGSDETAGSSDDDGVGCAEFVGESSGEETAEGSHTDEGHRVVAHDTAPLVLGDEGLDDGVAGREALHHTEADDEHKEERQNKMM